MSKKNIKCRAYKTSVATDGIWDWTRHHWDFTAQWRADDVRRFIAVSNALTPQARVTAMQGCLKTLDETSPPIRLHAAAIRGILARVPKSGMTKNYLDELAQADLHWRNIVILRDALPLTLIGMKFKGGRKTSAVSTLRLAIRQYLKHHPGATVAAIWAALAGKPPRRHTFCDNHAGKYIEVSTAGGGIKNITYHRFQNVIAEERRFFPV